MNSLKSQKAALFILFACAFFSSSYADGKISPVQDQGRSKTAYFELHDFDHSSDDFFLHGLRKFDFFDIFGNSASSLSFEKEKNYTVYFQSNRVSPTSLISYIFIDLPPPIS